MYRYVTVPALAVYLAAVSALLAFALLWQRRAQHRLQRARRLGDESRWISSYSVTLSVGHVLLLGGCLWIVAQSVYYRSNPYLVVDPQICPPQPPQGPRYPCDPPMTAISAASQVQLMWCLLVIGSAWYALSVWVLIAGSRARRAGRRSGQYGQRGAAQSE